MRQILHLIVVASLVLIVACNNKSNAKKVEENYSLKSGEDIPFATSVFKKTFDLQFSEYLVENNYPFAEWYDKEFGEFGDEYAEYHLCYVSLSPRIVAREHEVRLMRKFLEKGNDIILITDHFSTDLKDAFMFSQALSPSENPNQLLPYTPGIKYIKNGIDSTLFKYEYLYTPFLNYLKTKAAVVHKDTIGYNQHLQPDILRIKVGKGTLTIATNARGFSNYFLLTQKNISYAQNFINYISNDYDEIVWDNFYVNNIYRQAEEQSIFDTFFKNKALKWAFFIVLWTTLIWILLSMRRKQRKIAVVKPNSNSSVEFAETISNLYYNQHDNKNIAHKMINHFMEQMRTKYYLRSLSINNKLPEVLAAKTNTPIQKTTALYNSILNVQQQPTISDTELMVLHHQMQEIIADS